MSISTYMPTRMITGINCVKAGASHFSALGKHCLIMTGKNSARACGALEDVTAVLDTCGITYTIFDGVRQNPLLTDCMQAAELAISEHAEFIIGIGGGSPLDSAKCTAVLSANPGMTQELLYSLKWPSPPLPIVCVGTTAGTGSEVTKVSVITNLQGFKKSFNHDLIYPVVSFGDPRYTYSLNDYFTRSTAVDALAHCIESYFNKNADELSRAYAVSGIRILRTAFASLRLKECEHLTPEDRALLYDASIYGGLAINKTGTCLPHSMGYLLSEEYSVPHGFACCAFLPAFIEMNEEAFPKLADRLYRLTGYDHESLFCDLADLVTLPEIRMSEEKIAAEHKRWVGNGSIGKALMKIEPEVSDELLRTLFKA